MGYKYTVGYAPSGRAQCRKCGRPIKLGSLRISRESDAIAHFGDHGIVNHFHWRHAFDTMKRSNCTTNVVLSSGNLKGFNKISPGDQKAIVKEIGKFSKKRSGRCGLSKRSRRKSSRKSRRKSRR